MDINTKLEDIAKKWNILKRKVPFLRDNGWIFMPIFYLGLIVIVVGTFFVLNKSHYNTEYNVGSVDGISVNENFQIDKPLYKNYLSNTKEYEAVSSLLEVSNFYLLVKDTNLQDLEEVSSFYSGKEGLIESVGYFGYSENDCKIMKAISISNLGKHHMNVKDNGITQSLSWESNNYKFVFLNNYLSDGINLKSFCTYIVSNK